MEPNDIRADRCGKAIDAYGDDLLESNLIDLLADARHWCDLNGQSFWELDRRAHRHYLTEIHTTERTNS
jgi:hypothetical protein